MTRGSPPPDYPSTPSARALLGGAQHLNALSGRLSATQAAPTKPTARPGSLGSPQATPGAIRARHGCPRDAKQRPQQQQHAAPAHRTTGARLNGHARLNRNKQRPGPVGRRPPEGLARVHEALYNINEGRRRRRAGDESAKAARRSCGRDAPRRSEPRHGLGDHRKSVVGLPGSAMPRRRVAVGAGDEASGGVLARRVLYLALVEEPYNQSHCRKETL